MNKKTVTLEDGKELTLNLNRVSIGEWRDMFEPDAPKGMDFEILGRVAGLTKEEARALGYLDWLRLRDAVRDLAVNPLADPT